LNPILTSILSIAAFILSLIAIHFTFRKDAHRIRLEAIPVQHGALAININNDSGCDVEVLSVGYFDGSGIVYWIDRVGEYQRNKWIDYPILVKARSMLCTTTILGRDVPHMSEAFGVCIQLSTGRLYATKFTSPWETALKLHFASLLSRISGGRYVTPGIERPRIPPRLKS
jgi:hypothetical protein